MNMSSQSNKVKGHKRSPLLQLIGRVELQSSHGRLSGRRQNAIATCMTAVSKHVNLEGLEILYDDGQLCVSRFWRACRH